MAVTFIHPSMGSLTGPERASRFGWTRRVTTLKWKASQVYISLEIHRKAYRSSRGWFRSIDLWVMGPARFRCATLLSCTLILT